MGVIIAAKGRIFLAAGDLGSRHRARVLGHRRHFS